MLPAFFEGTLDNVYIEEVLRWKNLNDDNLKTFNDTEKVWERTELLQKMQKYNAENALEKVNRKIENTKKTGFFRTLQKIAAVLILPLFIATLYFANKNSVHESNELYTLKTCAGMRSEYVLPDGTKVYLNSKTSLSYPVTFTGATRDVKLDGEAYFEVAENKKQPFIVNTGNVNIEVTGTEFKASNYEDEGMTEIVLVEGAVRLFQGDYLGEKEMFKALVPGEKATYVKAEEKLYYEKVDIEKYIAWKDGKLMFRDDTMQEVARRLNRWFNVDIQLTGNDLDDYVYKATFEDETLIQVLDLLKISAPIDYQIKERERKTDNTFSNMEIEIIQK